MSRAVGIPESIRAACRSRIVIELLRHYEPVIRFTRGELFPSDGRRCLRRAGRAMGPSRREGGTPRLVDHDELDVHGLCTYARTHVGTTFELPCVPSPLTCAEWVRSC